MTAPTTTTEMRDALRRLRGQRRSQRLRNIDWVDALYRAYVIGISLVTALVLLAFVVGDSPVSASTLHRVAVHGPAWAGALVALVIALGLRSGSHGGPLAFEAADVHHVLLAPVDRGLVIRAAAYRQLRGVISAGVLGGAIVGIVAAPRFPGPDRGTAAWVVSGIAFGLLTTLAGWASALVASVARLGQARALVIGGAVLAWSVADILASTRTSPLTWLGHIAFWPLRSSWLALPGALCIVALVTAGLTQARRISLEPVLRRAQLVTALRFAATVQDLRAVITVRRQLAHEQSRSRPWFRVPRRAPVGRAEWRRDWQGIARWPGARVVRVSVLTVVAGASSAAAVRGTTPLFAVAAIAGYVIALDVIEGLAQEVDHPDRGSAVPLPVGDIYLGHLKTPAAVHATLAAIGIGVGLVVASIIPRPHDVHPVSAVVGIAVVLAFAAAAPTAAALSVYLGRPDRDLSIGMMHPGFVAAQQFAPLVVVALAFLPLIVAREVDPPTDPIRAAFAATVPVMAIAFGIVTFLRGRNLEVG